MAATLTAGHRVDLVDDHGAHLREHGAAAVGTEQHIQRFRRGDEDMGRPPAHGAAFGLRSIARAHGRTDAVRRQVQRLQLTADAFQRRQQVDLDVVGQGLQWRHIQNAGFVGQRRFAAFAHQRVDRGQKGGQRLSRSGRGGDQRRQSLLDQRPGTSLRLGRASKSRCKPACDSGMKVMHRSVRWRQHRPKVAMIALNRRVDDNSARLKPAAAGIFALSSMPRAANRARRCTTRQRRPGHAGG